VSMLLAIAVVTAGVPLLMLTAQQRQRLRAALPRFGRDWHALRVRYASTDAAALLLILLTAGLATLAFTVWIHWLGKNYQAALPPGLYQRMPTLTWGSCLVPSLVLGILTGVLVSDLALRLALGDRYGEYEFAFGGGGPGRPGDRGMPLLTFVVAGLVTAWVTLGLDRYSRFEEDRVVINPFWGFGERSYPYSAVEAVVRTSHYRRKGRDIEHTRYYIFFSGGERWCNEAYEPAAPGVHEEDAALVDFVCRKSGKPLTCVRHLEDVTGR
jgi:hypothetical protein